jgi:hypothetical protein
MTRGARVTIAAATVAMFAVTSMPQSASAYWSVASSASSSGVSTAARVNRAAAPSAVVSTQNDITTTWPASTLSNGTAVSAYTVTRYSSTNVATPATGSCSGSIAGITCTEANVPDGLWTYAITARVGTNWAGAESAKSVAVWSDTVAPSNVLSLTPGSGNAILSGSIVYYRGAAGGSFVITNAVTDAASGPTSSTTAALGGTSTGWGHTGSTVTTPTGGPYVSNSFSWILGASAAPTELVTGRDVAGNSAASTLTFRVDNTGPTGGAISYLNGVTFASSITVTLAAIADSLSGTAGGTRALQVSTAPLPSMTCGTFGPFTTAVANPAASQAVSVTANTCYKFRYVFTDALTNSTTTTSTSIVQAK